MAKNKNRKQGSQQDRASHGRACAGAGAAVRRSQAQQSPMSQAQGSPADVARKHQRRFGHN